MERLQGETAMKVTGDLVKLFKQDQEKYGTKVAISNLLYLNAHQQLRDLGVRKTKTDWKKGK